MKQDQFLQLATAEEAHEHFWNEIKPQPVGEEEIPLCDALNRILSRNVISQVNVPFFNRSNFDGYAVRAADTFGAEELQPVTLHGNPQILMSGVVPSDEHQPGTATTIATGGVLPRGADAVVMVEDTLYDPQTNTVKILKPVVPGSGVSFAGSDIGLDEMVLQKSEPLSYRETGVLAAIGCSHVWAWKKPRVAIISTGDEIINVGDQMSVGKVYDSNGMILTHAVQELGCEPVRFGIVPDNEEALETAVRKALDCDFILLSGGTSKGEGDLNYRVIQKLGSIIVHGVALKPGKPLCLANLGGTPAAILPGFPTSAIFTFTKFIAPFLREMTGASQLEEPTTEATLPFKLNSPKGKTQFSMVNISEGENGLSAYGMGKGSGSITTFAKADGFIEIPRNTEMLEAGTRVNVKLLGKQKKLADLTIIGSQCVGLDYLVSRLSEQGIYCKTIAVGSMGGVMAARRKECDLAGSHLMNTQTGEYNTHLINDELTLVKGYRRKQGIVFNPDNPYFDDFQNSPSEKALEAALNELLKNNEIRMVNRNRGSGTRVVIDQLLQGQMPCGFYSEVKSHNTVAATIAQHRADWGVAIETVAQEFELGFIPLQDEEFDFIIPNSRIDKPAVKLFMQILQEERTKIDLYNLGFNQFPI